MFIYCELRVGRGIPGDAPVRPKRGQQLCERCVLVAVSLSVPDLLLVNDDVAAVDHGAWFRVVSASHLIVIDNAARTANFEPELILSATSGQIAVDSR